MEPEAKQDHHQQETPEGQPPMLPSEQVGSPEGGSSSQEKEHPSQFWPRRGEQVGSWLQILFNFFVVLFTGALVWLSYGQLEVTRKSVEVAQEATEATKRAAEAAVIAAHTAQGQLEEMKNSSTDTKAVADAAVTQAANMEKLAVAAELQSKATKDMAEAATSSVRIADQTLTLTQRPWVWVKHRIKVPLAFQEMKAWLVLDEVLENIGQSVAVEIVSWTALVPQVAGGFQDALARQSRHCDTLCRPKQSSLSELVLLPRQKYHPPPPGHLLTIPAETVKKAISLAPSGIAAGHVEIVVIGCVSYRASFETVEARRHQTRFMYVLGHGIGMLLNPSRPVSELKDLSLIPVPAGTSAD